MATFIVTTSDDNEIVDGFTSLREALVLANSNFGADTITFDAALTGVTIVLNGSELVLASDVTIDGDINGDGAADIMVSGNNLSRVFNATSGTANLYALSITGGNSSDGGGLYVDDFAIVNLTNSTLSGNYGYYSGAISNSGTVSLTNSTLSGNSAGFYGGGIGNFGAVTLINSTLSGNSAGSSGGGIYNGSSGSGSTVDLLNSTLSGNFAGSGGGGIDNRGTTTITNSIVLGNAVGSGSAEINFGSGTVSFVSSLTGFGPETPGDVFAFLDGSGGGLLADNGGPVETIALSQDPLNPALDIGSNGAGLLYDAIGNNRAVDLPGIGGAIVDAGAVELQGVQEPPSLIVTTASDIVDAFDFETSLREALAFANSNADFSTITFDVSLLDQTILLDGIELVLSSDLTIDGDITGDGIADITVSGNNASRVFNATSGTSNLYAMTITDGNSSAGAGGGLYVASGATVNVENSTLSDNFGNYGGGAIRNSIGGTVSLTNSTLSANSGSFGGGIDNFGALTLVNSTLSGNSANSNGGGIYSSGTLTLTNTTLSGNSAVGSGGGIENIGTATLTNSIVLGNSAATGAEISSGSGGYTSTASLTGAGGETAADVFAFLDGSGGGLLADNGGPVETIALSQDPLNPALDIGSNGAGLLYDAIGNNRAVDLPGIGGAIVDAGAVELQGVQEPPSLIVTTASDIVDAFDFETSLREALAFANSNADFSTITFDVSLLDQTILLDGIELVLSSDLTIDGDITGDGIADITVSGNNASRVFNATSGTADIYAMTIADGNSVSGGGGLYIASGATVGLINSTLSSNIGRYGGGGIANYGTVTLTNSTLSENTSTISQGGGIENYGSAALTNSTLSGNYAFLGGGIFNGAGVTIELTNSTLSGNSAYSGGGIDNFGTVTLTNTTISGNTASGEGGGLRNLGTATLTNSIVLGNTGGYGAAEISSGSGGYTSTASLTGSGGEAAGDVFAALDGSGGGLLADNGGLVQTIALNQDALNPALDIGLNGAGLLYDAIGNDRAVDLPGIGAAIVDAGAVELREAQEPPSLIVTISSDVVDPFDLETSLREALAFANSNADASTITFDGSLVGQTILLDGTELVISSDVNIDGDITGDGAADISVSGNDASRVFNATSGTADIYALTITDGNSSFGGGLNVALGATVNLTNSTVSDNYGSIGGGIRNFGEVTLNYNTLSENSATIRGGGISNYGTATLIDSTITSNSGGNEGGGISNNSGSTLTLTNSTLSGNFAESIGGGITNSGDVMLTNSTLSGNSTNLSSGAINNQSEGTVTLIDSTLSGNSASNNGGGIGNLGDVTLTNSTLSDNSADFGGGINNSGTATLIESILTGNYGFSGGGIANSLGSTLTLTNSTLSGNSADGNGGAISNNTEGTVTLIDSTLIGNVSGNAGGGIANSGNVTLTESTFSGNSAGGSGGGIFNSSAATVDLLNSTLSGNSANSNGGGIYSSGTLTLTNTTLSGNSAVGSGGGIENIGTATLTNSIVLGNSAATGAEISSGSGGYTSNASLTGAGGETAAEVFVALDGVGGGLLADNGGPVQTIALNPDALNPALDIGLNGAGLLYDAIGNNRAVDLPGIGAAIVDAGAVELREAQEPPSLIVTISSDVVDPFDLETSLREALAFANSNADVSTITFDGSLVGQTILLDGTELVISSDVNIDGDITGDGAADISVSGNDASRVFNATSGTSSLYALTITDGNSSAGAGGGLYVAYGATVDLANSTLSGNFASSGGGISNSGTLTLNSSTLSGNFGLFGGGGVSNASGSTLTLTNSTLSGNSTDDNGGGVSNASGATLELINSAVIGNYAPDGVGGITSFGALILNHSTVSGNSGDGIGGIANFGTAILTNSTLSGNYGSAFFNSETAELNNSTLSGNSATLGAGIWSQSGTITLISSTISENVAADSGGGISNGSASTAYLINSTLSRNQANRGGGIDNFFGTVTLTNTTLSGNQADRGGGIDNYAGTATLTNSIILGNSAASGEEINSAGGGIVSANNSLTGLDGETAAEVFASLNDTGGGLLADNGGPVQTIALLNTALNPAIDAGEDSVAPETDATGGARFDVPSAARNGVNISDLGAFEVSEVLETDDFLPGTNAASFGSLTPNLSSLGAIEQDGDRDRFNIDLQAGVLYDISLEGYEIGGSPLNNPEIIGLYDSFGNFIEGSADDDSGIGANAAVEGLTVPADGLYQLEVASAEDVGVGRYYLSVESAGFLDDFLPGISEGLGSISVGGTEFGTIDFEGDVDGFEVELQARRVYEVRLVGQPVDVGERLDPVIEGVEVPASGFPEPIQIAGSFNDDEFLGDSVSRDSRSVFSSSVSGTHVIQARGFDVSVGDYSLEIFDLGLVDDYGADPLTQGQVLVNSSVDGSLEYQGDRDWFSVFLDEDQRYLIEMTGPDGSSLGAGLQISGIYDAEGQFIGNTTGVTVSSNPGRGRYQELVFEPNDSGIYFVSSGAGLQNTGDYSISVTNIGPELPEFNIQIDFLDAGEFEGLYSYFLSAADRWEQVIRGDLPSANVESIGYVDDLRIEVDFVPDDALGDGFENVETVRARTFVTEERPPDAEGNVLPYAASISVGEEFAPSIGDYLEDLAINAIGRALGFGSLWNRNFLLTETNGETRYEGPNALREFSNIDGLPGDLLIEDGLKSNGEINGGLANEYWDEETFTFVTDPNTQYSEVMTSLFSYPTALSATVNNVLSRATIGAMEDLGYEVRYGVEDSFSSRVTQGNSPASNSRPTATAASDIDTRIAEITFDQKLTVLNEDYSPLLSQTFALNDENTTLSAFSESSFNLFEQRTGENFTFYFEGNFQENSPNSLEDVRGTVTSITAVSRFGQQLLEISGFSKTLFIQDALAEVLPTIDFALNNAILNRSGGTSVVAVNAQAEETTVLSAGDGDDYVSGDASAEILIGGPGDDVLDGGGGADIARYSGAQTSYTLMLSPTGTILEDRRADGDGLDWLVDVELIDFATEIFSGPFSLETFGGAAELNADEFESFIELYIAYFNRAPDAIGLGFWGTQFANGLTLEEMAALFGPQEETRNTYPEGTSNTEFATAVYNNVLGRTPDLEGFNFWVGLLDDGSVSRDQFILAVLRGVESGSTDRAYLDNKVDVGAYFAVHKGMSDGGNGSAAMALFTGTQESIDAAVMAIDGYYQAALDPTAGEFLMPVIGVLQNPFIDL